MELSDGSGDDEPRVVMAYSQFTNLDFFSRFDGKPGPIRWPRVSINMLEKVQGPPPAAPTS